MAIDIDQVYETSLMLFQQNRVDAALDVVRDAKLVEPNNGILYHIAGQFLNAAGRAKQAEIECRTGLKLDANFTALHLTLTRALNAQQRFEEALKETEVYAEKSQEMDPRVVFYRADAFAGLGEWEKARDEVTHAIQIQFDLADGLVRRCMFNYQLHDWKATLEDADFAMQFELPKRERVIVLQNRGVARLFTEDLTGAEADLTEAIELDPEDFIPYFDRARLFEAKGEIEKAITDLNRGVELCECATHYAERGNFLMQNDRADEALKDFERASELDDDPEFVSLLGEARAAVAGKFKR